MNQIPDNLLYINIDIEWQAGPKFYSEGLITEENKNKLLKKLKLEHGLPLGYLNHHAPKLMHYANIDDIYWSSNKKKIQRYCDKNKRSYYDNNDLQEVKDFLKDIITL